MITIHIKERPHDMPICDRMHVSISKHIMVFNPLQRRFKVRPAERLLRRAGLLAIAVFPGIPYAGLVLLAAPLTPKEVWIDNVLKPCDWWLEQWSK
jgi:hypothetical protein